MSTVERIMLILRLIIPTVLSEIPTCAFFTEMQTLQFGHSFGRHALQHGSFLHLFLQLHGRGPKFLGGDSCGSSNRIIGRNDAIFGTTEVENKSNREAFLSNAAVF